MDPEPAYIDALATLDRLDSIFRFFQAGTERLAKHLDRLDLLTRVDQPLNFRDLQRSSFKRCKIVERRGIRGVKHIVRRDHSAAAVVAFLRHRSREIQRSRARSAIESSGHKLNLTDIRPNFATDEI